MLCICVKENRDDLWARALSCCIRDRDLETEWVLVLAYIGRLFLTNTPFLIPYYCTSSSALSGSPLGQVSYRHAVLTPRESWDLINLRGPSTVVRDIDAERQGERENGEGSWHFFSA